MAKRLKLRICTWNIGNAVPPNDLSAWLGTSTDTYDIIVVGVQEANYAHDRLFVSPNASAVSDNIFPSSLPTSVPTSPVFRSLNSPQPDRAIKNQGRLRLLSKAIRAVRRKKSGPDVPASAATDIFVPESTIPLTRRTIDVTRPHVSCRNLLTTTLTAESNQVQRNTDTFRRYKTSPRTDMSITPTLVPEQHRIVSSKSSRTVLSSDSFSYVNEIKSVQTSKNRQYRLPPSLYHQQSSDYTHGCAHLNGMSPKPLTCTCSLSPLNSSDLIHGPSHSSTGGSECSPTKSRDNGQETSPTASPVTPTPIKFSKLVSRNMPNGYHLIAKGHMMEMKLLVYLHDRHRPRLDERQVIVEATGIANVVGNKGAVVAKVVLDGTSFCFINSHLAAHEGKKYMKSRNADAIEIMRSLERCGPSGVPFLHAFDHVFWLGDLNYRLDMQSVDPCTMPWTKENQFKHVVGLVNDKKYTEIAKLDELRKESASGKVFVGFAEGNLAFAPTFKVERGKGDTLEYQKSRIPAYCDRVMWHSKPMHRPHVKWREYDCVTNIDTSDHKPVFAVFDIVIPKRVEWLPLPAPWNSYKCVINFLHLEIHSFCPCEKDGASSEVDSLITNTTTEDGNYELISEGPNFYEESHDSSHTGYTLSDMGSEVERESPRPSIRLWGGQVPKKFSKSTSSSSASSTNSPGDARRSPALRTWDHYSKRYSVCFHGGDLFMKDEVFRTEIFRHGDRLYCEDDELPSIAIRPVASLSELMYKYINLVCDRVGTKQGSACTLPIANLVTKAGKYRWNAELPLTKYGPPVGSIEMEVELNVSREGWFDSKNRPLEILEPPFR